MATRDYFFDLVYDEVKKGEDIVIVSADLASWALDKFRIDYPGRYVNVGISEQNLFQVASGLALTGKKVIAYGSAPFIWSRSYEQIRVLLGCMDLPVTTVSIGVGFNFAHMGPTHIGVEDITLMRSVPHMQINCVNNDLMAKVALEYSLKTSHPNFLRMGSFKQDEIYTGKMVDYQKGFISHFQSTNLVLVTYGPTVADAVQAVKTLRERGTDIGLIELISIPCCEELLAAELRSAKKVLSIEEHVRQGGVGDYLFEMINGNDLDVSLKCIAFNFKDGYYYGNGTQRELQKLFGIDQHGITKACEIELKK